MNRQKLETLTDIALDQVKRAWEVVEAVTNGQRGDISLPEAERRARIVEDRFCRLMELLHLTRIGDETHGSAP